MDPVKEEKSIFKGSGWTIKGIDQETRSAVQKAAKKEKMTLGKYCNAKLREAAVNTLKISNKVPLKPEDIKEEVKIQIEALKEDLAKIVRRALEDAQPQKTNLLKRIFNQK